MLHVCLEGGVLVEQVSTTINIQSNFRIGFDRGFRILLAIDG